MVVVVSLRWFPLPKILGEAVTCKSKFAEHLISENHNYTNFKTNLIPLHICKEGRYLNDLKVYEIYKAYNNTDTRPRVLNDKLLLKSNVLYNTALRYCRGGSKT